jgi:hypothetical protein
LQDISEVDAMAEGVQVGTVLFGDQPKASQAYRLLWNSLHGPEAWDANPWVVAVSFSVRQGNIDD